MINYREMYADTKIIVSVSGGKDSTAMCLNLIENGFSITEFTRVFCDTGWEDITTYQYLDYLENHIGPIIRLRANVAIAPANRELVSRLENQLGFESDFIRYVVQWGKFPATPHKYCTDRLKIRPYTRYLRTLEEDYVNLVGIRAEESVKRSKYKEWEYFDTFECYTHRPLLNWTEKQVIDIHNRHNVLPNALYLNGHSRVGCYPCIMARKAEIRKISEERISIIRVLENIYDITYFKGGKIDQMRSWSMTSRGGTQFFLFDTEKPTCEKWGLCEFANGGTE